MRDSRWEDFREECRVNGKLCEWAQEQYVKLAKRW